MYRPASGGLGLLLKVKRSKVSDLLCLFFENASYTEFVLCFSLVCSVCFLCISTESLLGLKEKCTSVCMFDTFATDNTYSAADH